MDRDDWLWTGVICAPVVVLAVSYVGTRLYVQYEATADFLENDTLGMGIVECTTSAAQAFVLTVVAGGLLWGALIALAHFIGSLRFVKSRTRKLEKYGGTEPACNSYFYWRGDWIFNNVQICRYNFDAGRRSLTYYLRGIADTWRDCRGFWMRVLVFAPVLVFQLFRIITGAVAMLVLSSLLFVPYLVLGVFMFLLIFSTSLVLSILERVVMMVRGIFVLCPTCSRRISRPMYRCPSCGRTHRQLSPSPRYGILMHRCECGKLLPTTRFMGRNKLTSFCPHGGCEAELSAFSEDVRPVTLALIGGTSTGKSMLQAAAINYLVQNHGAGARMSRNEEDIRILLDNWRSGSIQSTRLEALNANGLDFVSKGGVSANRRLYFYDPAGESFTSDTLLSAHRHYNNLACSIVVIDPFSLPKVRSRLEALGKAVPAEVRASTLLSQDVFSAWMRAMDTAGKVKKTYCAVVLNKMDHPLIQEVAGFGTGAKGEQCREFLVKHGLPDIPARAGDFKESRFFSVSSLAPAGNGKVSDIGLTQLMLWVEKRCL